MTEAEFNDWLRGKQHYWEYQASERHEFSATGLSMQFVPYFRTGQRIKVLMGGEELTGTVGVTTGWQPTFLLMRSKRAVGSPHTLSDEDQIVAIQRHQKYVPLQEITS